MNREKVAELDKASLTATLMQFNYFLLFIYSILYLVVNILANEHAIKIF